MNMCLCMKTIRFTTGLLKNLLFKFDGHGFGGCRSPWNMLHTDRVFLSFVYLLSHTYCIWTAMLQFWKEITFSTVFTRESSEMWDKKSKLLTVFQPVNVELSDSRQCSGFVLIFYFCTWWIYNVNLQTTWQQYNGHFVLDASNEIELYN